jgi:PQQ-like domain
VDEYIYGQPLYVPGLIIDGVKHNVVYVATENNSVYAFDADGKGQLWRTPFGLPVKCSNALVSGCGIAPVLGITATPVIDTGRGKIYVESRHFDPSTGRYWHSIHSLNLLTGKESPSAVPITAKFSGTGYDAVNGMITFNPQTANSRGALLELNGVIYVVYSQPGDTDPYHGWILGYSADTLGQVSVYNPTRNGKRGGIWAGSAGPASDGIYLFVATGNGTWENGGPDWGDSYLKLSTTAKPGTLTEIDFFTPFNGSTLTADDRDLGSAMATLITLSPTQHIMIGAGKEGRIYVVNRDGMGHFGSTCDCQIIQSIPNAVGVADNTSDLQRNFSTPPYWNGNVYFGGAHDHIRRFVLNTSTSKLSTSTPDQSVASYGYPGSNLVISANGNGSGVLWAVDHGANVMHAYNALHLATELYNTAQNSTRDSLTNSIKFAPPLVINGKVYVGTRDHLVVYGTLP